MSLFSFTVLEMETLLYNDTYNANTLQSEDGCSEEEWKLGEGCKFRR